MALHASPIAWKSAYLIKLYAFSGHSALFPLPSSLQKYSDVCHGQCFPLLMLVMDFDFCLLSYDLRFALV